MNSRFEPRKVQPLHILQWDVDVESQNTVPQSPNADHHVNPAEPVRESEEQTRFNDEEEIEEPSQFNDEEEIEEPSQLIEEPSQFNDKFEIEEPSQVNDESEYEDFHIENDDQVYARGFCSDNVIDNERHSPNSNHDEDLVLESGSSGMSECEDIACDQDHENSDISGFNTGMEVTMISNDDDTEQDYDDEDERESDDENLFIVGLVYIGSAMLIDS